MLSKRGAELDSHYVKLLRELGKASGILGQIFTKSQNKLEKNVEEKENLVYDVMT